MQNSNNQPRLICLDTETTGLNSKTDRIIEIGCVDITKGLAKKKTYQQYINPGTPIPEEGTKVHGITNEYISRFLNFQEYVMDFLNFIKDATLIIHNARFDISFLNEELSRSNLSALTNPIIDTLKLSKEKFPGEKASLDALMKKFKIAIEREKHGALLDAEILAQIYFAMIQNQSHLKLTEEEKNNKKEKSSNRLLILSNEEIERNQKFFNKTNDKYKN